MTKLMLIPGNVTLSDLHTIYRDNASITLERSCKGEVERSARLVAEAAASDLPVYGVNTGFGKLASVKIAPEKTAELQRNLVLSHACGVGEEIPDNIVRLIMALKLISLGRGASGVRWRLIEVLEEMLDRDVTPIVPRQGSVGASGDLAPLAHIAAVIMGQGDATFDGQLLSGGKAMANAGIAPVELSAKEGLALINGTQVSTALALWALFDTHLLFRTALITGALSTDAGMASTAPFRSGVHALRGHKGQIDAAAALWDLLQDSEIRESHREGDERVQDPYCLRCQPQVMGACLDMMRYVANVLTIEANAVTDNPLIFCDEQAIVSGGNFHAEPVAFAADQIALAIAEIGAISQRRIAMLVDPALSFGLPAFLTPEPGLNSGFMIAEVTSATLMSENKQRATPCSVDSTPTSANQEDHVSMACHGAWRLLDMNANLANIIAIELLTGAQGIELRAPLTTSPPLRSCISYLRNEIPFLQNDRYMAPDLQKSAQLVTSGAIAALLPDGVLPGLAPAQEIGQ